MRRVVIIFISMLLFASVLTGCDGASIDNEKTNSESASPQFNNIFDDVPEGIYMFGKNPEYKEGAITIALCGGVDLPNIIRQYIKEVDHINIVEYPLGYYHGSLNTKLMAKDSDIDIFFTQTLDICSYITTHAYEDLSNFDILKERFESNEYANFIASYNDTYVGVPIGNYYYDSSTANVSDTFNKYLVRNLSALNGEFKDKDGEEFYRVLRYLYDNPDDPKDTPFYEGEIGVIGGDFLMMNPYSEKKEQAAEFLAYCFDILNGDIETDGYTVLYPYIELESYENVSLYWDHQPWSIVEPLKNVYNSFKDTDGSDEELKELAQDAARQTDMRMNG